MAKRAGGKYIAKYLLGKCVPSSKDNAAKIRISRLQLDERLLAYFREYRYVYAVDPEKRCKTGDTVLIQNLPEKLTRLISHKIVEIVYPLGDVTDPLTGKKVIATKYRGDVEKANELYGVHGSAFDYNEAPPRGKMEGIRDFSHKKSYMKYQEDPDNPQPYAINP